MENSKVDFLVFFLLVSLIFYAVQLKVEPTAHDLRCISDNTSSDIHVVQAAEEQSAATSRAITRHSDC